MDDKYFERLEEAAADEIEQVITELVNSDAPVITGKVEEMQPPRIVIRLAAEAAAKVIVSFERGTRRIGS